VETKFARLAHVVRGGDPTLADRLLATKMGVHAVDQLLDGKSNLILCQKDSKIVTCEILYSQCLDRMYKGTLKEGMLEKFSEEEINQMKAEIEQKKKDIAALYTLVEETAR
jgi:6-phosphofructokinase